MRYLLLAVTLISAFHVHAQGGHFTIKGRVAAWKGRDSIQFSYVEDGRLVLDSAIAVDGRFTLSGTIRQPLQVGVSATTRRDKVTRTLDNRVFYLNPGTLTLEAKDSLCHATVGGSQFTPDYDQLQHQLSPLINRFIEIKTQAIKMPVASRSTPEFKALEVEYKAMIDTIQKVRIAFIKSHPGSYVALDVLQQIAGSMVDYNKISPLFNGLSEQLRHTSQGMDLERRLLLAQRTDIGAVLPGFECADTAGNMLRLDDIVKKGKLTLVDFWASWCGPCRKENPNVVRAYTSFHDKGFNIISVSLDKSADAWKKAITKDGMPWYHVSNLKYWEDPIAAMYGITAVPDNFLLDANGKVVGRRLSGDELYKKIEDLTK